MGAVWFYSTTDTIRSVDISSDGNYIAAGGYGGTIYLFSRTSRTPEWTYGNIGVIGDLSLSSYGDYLAVPGGFKVYLFKRSDSTPLWSYTTNHYAQQASIASDGSYIAAGSADQRVYLFSRELSNTRPTLSSGNVSPTSGNTDTTFTYEAIYTDADGDSPSYVRVYIDGTSHSMNKVSGTYTGGALYRYTTSSLNTSSHTYYFTASDGIDTARLPTSGSYSGPTVTEKHSTSLTISPSSFTVGIGGSQDLSAMLEKEVTYIIGGGVLYKTWEPLAGKNITWSTTAGSFSPSSTATDYSGQASVTYYAPSHETSATITASFAGDSQWEASSDTTSVTIQFQVTLTFHKLDGSALANTTIYYGPSKGQETSYLGATDSQGKIISTNSVLAGETIYFKSSDGRYSGSTYVSSSGGTVSASLTEVSEFPILVVAAFIVAILIGCVAGGLAFAKRRREKIVKRAAMPEKAKAPPTRRLDRELLDYIVEHGGEVSIPHASKELGVSEREVKDAIERLKRAGKIEE